VLRFREKLAGPALALLEPLAGPNRLVPAFAGVSHTCGAKPMDYPEYPRRLVRRQPS
jgi:hypothetical protein